MALAAMELATGGPARRNARSARTSPGCIDAGYASTGGAGPSISSKRLSNAQALAAIAVSRADTPHRSPCATPRVRTIVSPPPPRTRAEGRESHDEIEDDEQGSRVLVRAGACIRPFTDFRPGR